MAQATRVVVAVVEVTGDDAAYAQWLRDFRGVNTFPEGANDIGTVLIMERGPFESPEAANAAYNSAHDLARAWANTDPRTPVEVGQDWATNEPIFEDTKE